MDSRTISPEEKRRMLYELSQTDGWKLVLEPLLRSDMDFIVSLTLGSPEQKTDTKELLFKMKELGEQRFAHGKYCEAQKILLTVTYAVKKLNETR